MKPQLWFALTLAPLAAMAGVDLDLQGLRSSSDESASRSMPHTEEERSARVSPGLVDWHASFADACEAAEVSGKPVMLFQLLGRLDEEFC